MCECIQINETNKQTKQNTKHEQTKHEPRQQLQATQTRQPNTTNVIQYRQFETKQNQAIQIHNFGLTEQS